VTNTKLSPKNQPKPVSPAPSKLAELAARIRAEHAATIAGMRRSMVDAMRVGDLLIEAKELLERGGWLLWLAENTSIEPRLAQIYMRLARNREQIESEISETVSYLTIPGILSRLSNPVVGNDAEIERDDDRQQSASQPEPRLGTVPHSRRRDREIELWWRKFYHEISLSFDDCKYRADDHAGQCDETPLQEYVEALRARVEEFIQACLERAARSPARMPTNVLN
jgi:hypothetical protein